MIHRFGSRPVLSIVFATESAIFSCTKSLACDSLCDARKPSVVVPHQGVPFMKRVLILMCALLVSVASSAGAQIASGNIYGAVVDEQGGVLPGVDVTLLSTSIGGAPRTTVTDSQGQFPFLKLHARTYKMTG